MSKKKVRLLILGALMFCVPFLVQSQSTNQNSSIQEKDLQYSCPMHPEVKSKTPGSCPKCGMTLKQDVHTQITVAAGGTSWGANYFPNVPLLTQEGKTVRFYDDLLKDKRVMIDFIYASCQQSCPLQTAKLAQLQKVLGSRVGHDIFIYSITLDPEHDTPAVLKAYAAKFGAGPGWLFLTGKREDVDAVRFKLGERGEKEGHGNSVRLGNVARGQWMRIPLTGDVNYLVTEVGKTLIPDWYAGQTLKSFDEAPRLDIAAKDRSALLGQGLFRGRCAACHTIGAGEHIGPDLKEVTARRERAWLVRYLLAPDQMLAGKDPIALELAKRSKVPMPNLGLTHEQIDYLIAYLEMQTSHAVSTTAAVVESREKVR